MSSGNRSSGLTMAVRHGAAAVAAALLVTVLHPTIDAQSGERWVGTWSTSEVGRPQTPPGPPATPGPPPFMPSACPAGRARRPPAFMHFTNQTLRQIVHTSIGGIASARRAEQRVRDGAAHDRRGARSRSATRRRRSRPASGRPLTFSGKPTITIPAGRRRSTAIRWHWRCRRWRTSPSISICPAPPTRRRPLTMHTRRAPDQLRLGDRQPRGRGDAAGRGDDAELVPARHRRRRHGAGRGGRHRRIRRLDHRRCAIDAGHEQPLARSSGAAAAVAQGRSGWAC